MNLSLKKEVGEGLSFLEKNPRKVDLLKDQFVLADGSTLPFDLEQWPIMLFLKGLGSEGVDIQDPHHASIGLWAERMSLYQSQYLDDPENFRVEECQWRELDSSTERILIEVRWPERAHRREDLKSPLLTTPPLEAPLGVDSEALRKFKDEVERQSPREILLRIQSILREFEKDAREREYSILGALILDVISIALNSKLLEKAVELSDSHPKALAHAWHDNERLSRALAAYDPKSSELMSWARIFSTLPTVQLFKSVDIHLSLPGGPQLVKLLSLRAQNESDELIELCFQERGPFRKTLHQWVSPFWRMKHYPQIWNEIHKSLLSEEGLRLWIPALLRSAPARAFSDCLCFFEKPSFFKRRKPHDLVQKVLLETILEHPTADAIQFVREIQSRVKGKLAFQAEKILSDHKHL